MKTCAVTCTGGRPELFALCRRWIERQTVPVDRWIVVTDNGEEIRDLPSFASFHHVTPGRSATNPDWRPNYALQQALALVPPDHAAVVFEDDDWYSPIHVETCMRKLAEGHGVTYCDHVIEFNLPARMWRVHAKPGASEGRVGIAPSDIATYAHRLLNRPLWSGKTDGRYDFVTTIGIKGVGFGLPGRAGATPPHGYRDGWSGDPQLRKFSDLLGDDADAYISLLQ